MLALPLDGVSYNVWVNYPFRKLRSSQFPYTQSEMSSVKLEIYFGSPRCETLVLFHMQAFQSIPHRRCITYGLPTPRFSLTGRSLQFSPTFLQCPHLGVIERRPYTKNTIQLSMRTVVLAIYCSVVSIHASS